MVLEAWVRSRIGTSGKPVQCLVIIGSIYFEETGVLSTHYSTTKNILIQI